jgi:copper homeostasis protein (lipoprotein)
MRKSVSLLLPVLALLALSACKREQAAPIAPAATVVAPATVQAPAPATVAPAMGVSESPAPGEHTTFDAKAFAGTFSSEGMDVAFAADGTYTLNTHAADASTGTWSLEPDARHIRLDPNAKSEDDRVYELVDNDHLKAANGPQVLRRAGSAQ